MSDDAQAVVVDGPAIGYADAMGALYEAMFRP
jgi:hypothetical protein